MPTNVAPAADQGNITNMQLRRVYTKLHEEQLDILKRSVIPMQLTSYINYPAAWGGSSVNLQFPLPVGSRVKTLYVASCFGSTYPFAAAAVD